MGNALIVAIYHNRTGSRLHGYRNGDPLQLVHEAGFGYIGPDWTGIDEPRLNLPYRQTWPLSAGFPRRAAEALTRILNGSWNGDWEYTIAMAYRRRGLRPIETGDVLVVDRGGPRQALLARHFSGWFTITEPLIPITERELRELEGARS